jgi:hypothetical protein
MEQFVPRIFAIILMLAASPAFAQTLPHADISDYGLYTVDRSNCESEARLHFCDESNVRHAATMTRVPAELGVTFGFRFRMQNPDPDDPAPMTLKVIFPAPGLANPAQAAPVPVYARDGTCRDGEICDWHYTLEYPWEVVPGSWTLQVWSGVALLAEKTFQMAPESDVPPGP